MRDAVRRWLRPVGFEEQMRTMRINLVIAATFIVLAGAVTLVNVLLVR